MTVWIRVEGSTANSSRLRPLHPALKYKIMLSNVKEQIFKFPVRAITKKKVHAVCAGRDHGRPTVYRDTLSEAGLLNHKKYGLLYNEEVNPPPKKPIQKSTGESTGTGPVSGAPGPAVVGPPQKPRSGVVPFVGPPQKPRSGVVSFVPNRSTGTGGGDRFFF
jgi:hypothetical protein